MSQHGWNRRRKHMTAKVRRGIEDVRTMAAPVGSIKNAQPSIRKGSHFFIDPYEVYREATIRNAELVSGIADHLSGYPKERVRRFGRGLITLFSADEYEYRSQRFADPTELRNVLESTFPSLPGSGWVEMSHFAVNGSETKERGLRFIKVLMTPRFTEVLDGDRLTIHQSIHPDLKPHPRETGMVVAITRDAHIADEMVAGLNELPIFGEKLDVSGPMLLYAPAKRDMNSIC